jgi:protein-L-isoaspartate(D-aspartate) O-methyltransferase
MADYAAARFNMVESQVKPNRVGDPALLAAMMAVPRERFVPAASRGIAHVDTDVALGGGRYLTEPMVIGRLFQEAQIGPADTVLVIASGTGYAAALAARLARRVVALEEEPRLASQARAVLAELGVANVAVVEGALAAGWGESAPYDVVLIDGAVSRVPQAALDQLAPGGRLLTVLRDGRAPGGGLGRACLFRKLDGVVAERVLFDAATPFLPSFAPQPAFVF